MARELYNWEQLRSYCIIALNNIKNKHKYLDLDVDEFLSELDPLQTMYGKEGVIGLANRYLKEKKRKRLWIL